MTLLEQQEQRGRLVAQAREALDEIKTNTDEARSADLDARHDKIMADFDKIEKNIEREEKLAAIEARAIEAEERARADRRPGAVGEAAASDAGEPVSYRDAFESWIRSGGDKSALNSEERSVLEQRAQTTTTTAGGFTIPEEFMPELVKSMLAWGPMYDPGVTREMVTAGGAAMPWPTVNDTTVTAGAHTEGATLTDDGGKDATFAAKTLNAYEFDTEFLRVSKALSDDSAFPMQSVIADLLGERLGRIANLQLTTGTGSSAPNGIVTASGLGTTAASTSAITADELITFQHEIDPAYRRAASVRWMFNDSTMAAIRKLKDGQGNYLWQMGDVRVGAPGVLLGHQYEINQDMAGLASGVSSKVVLFGDFQKYVVRKVGAPLIGALSGKDFWPGFGVAGYIRFDGELLDAAAVKHLRLAAA